MSDLYELRTYRALPGSMSRLVIDVGQDHLRALVASHRTIVGAWTCEFGALNRLLILCSIEDGATADFASPLSAGLAGIECRVLRSRRTVRSDAYGGVVEMRTYRTAAGQRAVYLQRMLAALPLREQHSPNIGVWTTEDGDLDDVVHLWGYTSLEHRMRAREGALSDDRWTEYLPSVYPLLRSMDTQILLPTAFSPLR